MSREKRMPLVAGNWKMHNNHLEALALTQQLAFRLTGKDFDAADILILPPFTALRSVQTLVQGDKLRLQKRGLIVLTCHTAVEEQARALVKNGFAPAGTSASAVADDILTHLIPGAIVVPSMVATLAVLQATYHYTYISPAI